MSSPAAFDDPRQSTRTIYVFVALVVIAGLGWLVGRLAPIAGPGPGPAPWTSAAGAGGGLLLIGVALLVSLPFLALAVPATFLSIEVVDAIVSLLLVAGLALMALRALDERGLVTHIPVSWLGPERLIPASVRGFLIPAVVGVEGATLYVDKES